MNRVIPQANRLTYEKEVKRLKKIHDDRIRKVTLSVDNRPPKRYTHLRKNLKREQMMEERFSAIERENRILLEKMSHIMQHTSLDNKGDGGKFLHSLTRTGRIKENERIAMENRALLERIQKTEPTFSVSQWEEERREMKRLADSISTYAWKELSEKKAREKRMERRSLARAGASAIGSPEPGAEQ